MIEKSESPLRANGDGRQWSIRNRFLLTGVAAGFAFAGILALPELAYAHGPTIKMSQSQMKPGLLNLFVGTTVHFVNTIEAPGGQVVVDESGALESPPIEKNSDGWHYTFENEGRHELHLRDHPDAKATVVVVPKKRPLPGHRPKSASPGP